MRMKNIFFAISLFCVSSCGYFKSQPPKIRLVGMDGKPRNVSTITPNLNSEVLNSQGRNNSNMIVRDKVPAQPSVMANRDLPLKEVNAAPSVSVGEKVVVDKGKVVSGNVPGDSIGALKMADNKPVELLKEDQIKNPDTILFAAPKESEEYDISDAKQEKFKKPEKKSVNKRIKKPIFISKNKVKTIEAEAVSETAPAAIKVEAGGDVSSGYYVQVGSFSSEAHAHSKLDKMSKFHAGKVESAADKGIYRALLGPFSNKNSARALLKKVKAAGNDAVLIKR